MIAIVDYKAGNLTSVQLAFDYLGIAARITKNPEDILRADRVVFPGVGSAGAAIRHLTTLNLAPALRQAVQSGKPFLGICLGTQIIFDRSEEDGGIAGLGLQPGIVRRFQPTNPMDKVPQIGWNAVALPKPHPVLEGIEDQSEFYFVHSYYPAPTDSACVLGLTDYAGIQFASMIGHNNLIATQFHPEKSGRIGLQLLLNFARWTGR